MMDCNYRFSCDNCKEYKDKLFLDLKYTVLGLCCEYCYNMYEKRLKEVTSGGIVKY